MSAIQSCAHHYGVIGGGIPQRFASAVDRDKWTYWQGDEKEKKNDIQILEFCVRTPANPKKKKKKNFHKVIPGSGHTQ